MALKFKQAKWSKPEINIPTGSIKRKRASDRSRESRNYHNKTAQDIGHEFRGFKCLLPISVGILISGQNIQKLLFRSINYQEPLGLPKF